MSHRKLSMLRDINNIICMGSEGFQDDIKDVYQYVSSLHTQKLHHNTQLDQQLKIAAMIAAILSWASHHPEDFGELADWWNAHIVTTLMGDDNERE